MPTLLGDEDAGPVERCPPPQRVASLHRPRPYPAGADKRPARHEEIEHRRRLLPDDLYYDERYAVDSTLWDTWLRDEHDVPPTSPARSRGRGGHWGARAGRGVRRRARVRVITPTSSPSPSPSPPPPPRMTEEEEARLMQRVMEDSRTTRDERQ
ncbi:hypothetical protein D1007_42032 [Hordeum vulgare]|nr:hypothetical protein D1007_42032 [Hordeum vulgare]